MDLAIRPLRTSLIFIAVALFAGSADARAVDDVAGRVVGKVDGREIELPMLRADYDVSIAGDVATVTLTQTFINPATRPMSASYLFPLNKSSAVYAMEMHVGDEIVKAVMQEKKQAEATFKQAEREGKAAALLTQHRPNMFTQDIANLMPGLPIKVVLRYVQDVPKIEGAHELVVPLIVGPRYQGADELIRKAEGGIAALGLETGDTTDDGATLTGEASSGAERQDGWTIAKTPAYPEVYGLDLPDTIGNDRVSLTIRLMGGGVPVGGVASATHDLEIVEDEEAISARLASGRTIDNRDFVLRYELGGEELTAGTLAHFDERGGFFSFMIAPPTVPDESMATPRELVFVLDTSGSMAGEPIDASKTFMDAALRALRPDDYFRILNFSNQTHQFSANAVSATPDNILSGRRFVSQLSASGGTEMARAIDTAFDTAKPERTLRIVVFLSDGYIGDEATVLRIIRNRIGDARIYAFGIGTSVNRYLLDGMAEEGRGYARYVDPTESADDVAETLARDLKTPLLTDITIDWGDLKVAEVVPDHLPDLFAGNTLRVFGRYQQGGRPEVKIKGLVQGRPASMPVKLDLPSAPLADPEKTEAIPLIWARRQIADHERAFAVRDGDADTLKRQITDLGLRYSLQTRYTSFVAVSETVVNEERAPVKRNVALPMVKGVKPSAYPSKPSFAGGAAPEPEALLGLTALGLLGGLMLRRRLRAARAGRHAS